MDTSGMQFYSRHMVVAQLFHSKDSQVLGPVPCACMQGSSQCSSDDNMRCGVNILYGTCLDMLCGTCSTVHALHLLF